MQRIKRQIPNIFTLLNLFSGCVALIAIFKNQYEYAFYFVALGIFFDFFDGFFARLLHVSSPLGLQLDSLADMVTSGVVPGATMFFLFQNVLYDPARIVPMSFIGFLITLGACYRLANFNIDTRQTDSFIGLPTPANALFIMSLPLIIKYNAESNLPVILSNIWILITISLASAFIMNAEIPLFSLKIKNFSFQKNLLQLFFIVTSILLIIIFGYLGVALTIVFYILLSVFYNFFQKKNNKWQ